MTSWWRGVDVVRGRGGGLLLTGRHLVSPSRCFPTGRLFAKLVSFWFLVHQCFVFLDSGVWNAGIILFMYLFILFHIDKKIAVK